jgi:hypothetical protein
MDLLLISGIPGTGKTTYARHLATLGWDRINHDVAGRSPLEPTWRRIFEVPPVNKDRVAAFVGATAGHRVVVEFGFPVEWLGVATAAKQNGATIWWFDGDRKASLNSWRIGWGGQQPDWAWQRQVDAIEAHWSQIRSVFEPNLLTARLPDRHLSLDELDARIQSPDL